MWWLITLHDTKLKCLFKIELLIKLIIIIIRISRLRSLLGLDFQRLTWYSLKRNELSFAAFLKQSMFSCHIISTFFPQMLHFIDLAISLNLDIKIDASKFSRKFIATLFSPNRLVHLSLMTSTTNWNFRNEQFVLLVITVQSLIEETFHASFHWTAFFASWHKKQCHKQEKS